MTIDCSIIIPVYNAEKTIINLLDRLKTLNIDKSNFEVILINDGSNDNSQEIIEKNIILCDNFKLINKQNGGVSSARNVGIENARGRYIFFCDSDDVLEIKTLETMLKIADENDVPLVIANYNIKDLINHCENSLSHKLPCNQILGKQFIEQEILRRFVLGDNVGLANLWNKLFSRKVLMEKRLRFDEKRTHGEDWAFNIAFFQEIDSIFCIQEIVYTYNLDGTQSSYIKYRKNIDYCLSNGYDITQKLNEKYGFFDKKSKEYKKIVIRFLYQIMDFIRLKEISNKAVKVFLKRKSVRSAIKSVRSMKMCELNEFGFSRRIRIVSISLLFGWRKMAIRFFQ